MNGNNDPPPGIGAPPVYNPVQGGEDYGDVFRRGVAPPVVPTNHYVVVPRNSGAGTPPMRRSPEPRLEPSRVCERLRAALSVPPRTSFVPHSQPISRRSLFSSQDELEDIERITPSPSDPAAGTTSGNADSGSELETKPSTSTGVTSSTSAVKAVCQKLKTTFTRKNRQHSSKGEGKHDGAQSDEGSGGGASGINNNNNACCTHSGKKCHNRRRRRHGWWGWPPRLRRNLSPEPESHPVVSCRGLLRAAISHETLSSVSCCACAQPSSSTSSSRSHGSNSMSSVVVSGIWRSSDSCRDTSSRGNAAGATPNALRRRSHMAAATIRGPNVDLSVFNADDYPLDDLDEQARQERAREIAEGVDPPPGFRGMGFYDLSLALQNLDSVVTTSGGGNESNNNNGGTNGSGEGAVSTGSGGRPSRPDTFISLPYEVWDRIFELVSSQRPAAAHTQIDYMHCLVPDLLEITRCSFYWGKMDRYEAERLLDNKPEGSFLLRDSAQDDYLFSVSFRRYGRSLHARIEQWNHQFSFDSHDPGVFSSPTVCGLIEHYKDPSCCMYFEPMLTIPLHRNNPFSLQHVARATVASRVTYDKIAALPIPKPLKTYLKEYHYKQRVRIRQLENDIMEVYFPGGRQRNASWTAYAARSRV